MFWDSKSNRLGAASNFNNFGFSLGLFFHFQPTNKYKQAQVKVLSSLVIKKNNNQHNLHQNLGRAWVCCQ